MRSLIFTVFFVFLAGLILQLLGIPFAIRVKFMELLGIGVILAKFAYDYYQNKSKTNSYLKYAIFSALAFLVYNGGLFSFSKLPIPLSLSLMLLSLLIFAMIGVNDSLKQLKDQKKGKPSNLLYIYLGIFAIHALYAFAMASSLLKGYNLNFLVPGILLIDAVAVLPFIIVRRAYDQYVLTGLFVISLSINTYILSALQNASMN